MGCALAIVFRARSLYVPIMAGYPAWSLFLGDPQGGGLKTKNSSSCDIRQLTTISCAA